MFQENRGRGLIQLEEGYAVEVTKLVEYTDSKEGPLIQIVRPHQRNVNSAVLWTAKCLKTEVQRGTGHIKDSTSEKT